MNNFNKLDSTFKKFIKAKKHVHLHTLLWIINKEDYERIKKEVDKGYFRCTIKEIAKDIIDFIPPVKNRKEPSDNLNALEKRVKIALKEFIELKIITSIYKAKSKKEKSIYRYNIINYSSKKEENNNVIDFKAKEFIESKIETENEIAVTTISYTEEDYKRVEEVCKLIRGSTKIKMISKKYKNYMLENDWNKDINYLKKIIELFNTKIKFFSFDNLIKCYENPIFENEDYKEPNQKTLNFTNYSQRAYDYDSLEKQLLGWDEEVENTENEQKKSIENLPNSTLDLN